jgi:hypothetical protein
MPTRADSQQRCEDKKKKKKNVLNMAVSEHDRETTDMFGCGFSTTQSNKQLNLKGKCTYESSNVHITLILLRERKYLQQIYKKSKSTQQNISIVGWRFQQRSDVTKQGNL